MSRFLNLSLHIPPVLQDKITSSSPNTLLKASRLFYSQNIISFVGHYLLAEFKCSLEIGDPKLLLFYFIDFVLFKHFVRLKR